MNEQGEKLPEDMRSEIEGQIEALKQAQESDDAQTIRAAIEDLRQASMKMGQQMYDNTGQHGGPNVGPDVSPAADEDPDVVDGEYREI